MDDLRKLIGLRVEKKNRGKTAPAVLTLFGIVKTETENNNKQLLDAHGINFASGADSKRKSSSLA